MTEFHNRVLDYVKPSGEPVLKDDPDLCVCGPMTRATHGCSCGGRPEAQETVLQEADRLVSTARGPEYGHPSLDFGKVSRMAIALWGRGPETAAEHALYMILVKLARLEATPGHRDSIVDIAGYAKTYAMVMERNMAKG